MTYIRHAFEVDRGIGHSDRFVVPEAELDELCNSPDQHSALLLGEGIELVVAESLDFSLDRVRQLVVRHAVLQAQ